MESGLGNSYQKSDHCVGLQVDSPKQLLSLMLLMVFSKSVLLSNYCTKHEEKNFHRFRVMFILDRTGKG